MIAVSGLTAITPNPGRHSWAGWRPWYKADAEHDYELQFERRGVEDKCMQSEAGFQGFLGRKGSWVR